ncbi:hypothetical protein MaudCBS49596_006168 [Microsporum audouinii]
MDTPKAGCSGAASELANTNAKTSVTRTDELSPVDWNGPDDPENPLNWTAFKKWLAITIIAYITFVTSYGSTIFAPGVPALLQEFGVTNTSLASFVVSIYILGFCVGPLFLAPFSELYGRMHIIHLSNVLFLIFSIACAVSTNFGMFIFFRLMQGVSACPALTLGGGMISDLMVPTERGKALSIWAMGPLLGPVVGPVIGGYMNETTGWRWTFWFTAIMMGVSALASAAILRETYAPILLERKAARFRKQTGNPSYKSKFDKNLSPGHLFKQAIIRPTKMLVLSPIVLVLAMHMSIIYSYLYFLFTTFTFVFEDRYGFSSGEVGLAYLGLGVGFIVGQFGVGYSSDLYVKKKLKKSGVMKPEYRLPPLVLSAFLIPVGLFWYGWTTEKQVHWIVPIVGTIFIGIGTMCAFLPIQMYLIDTFGIYAASALATNTVVRSLFGAVLPLAGPPLFKRLGLGWGNSLLAFIALALSPAAFFLLKYGEYIRTHPKFQVKL